LNLAKNASFCRACNENCRCENASDLCSACIADTGYYKDPKTNSCKPCNKINDNHKYCKECKYNDDLELPVCTTCASYDENNLYKII